MNEKQAYEVLGWPHDGNGNEGDGWLAFRCPTPGCQSEGVARGREFGFGRCGRCGAEMQIAGSTPTGAATPLPTKKSILIETVAFTESRPVAFLDHADRTLLCARLFPSSRCSASRDSCTPASAAGLAAFEPWA